MGDFSQTLANGQLVQIYDPSTAHLASDGMTTVRDPFPGNIIPASRIDPVAVQIVKFYPEPTFHIGDKQLRPHGTTPGDLYLYGPGMAYLERA
jgi:hypothetical protein